MYEKLSGIIDYLREEYGYSCRAICDEDGWGIQVDYIEEGPEFNHFVPMDKIILDRFSVKHLAEFVRADCFYIQTYMKAGLI